MAVRAGTMQSRRRFSDRYPLYMDFETDGLHVARQELLEKTTELKPLPQYRHKCARCKCSKGRWAVVTGDGAQMYKEVPGSRVLQRFQKLTKLTQAQTRTKAAALFRENGKPKPKLVKTAFRKKGVSCYSFEQIASIIRYSNAQCTGRLGPYTVYQKKGTQMGGVMSGIKASLDFGACEDYWIRHERQRKQAKFHLKGYQFSDLCVAIRYADDGLFASEVWCRRCLEHMGAKIYRRPILYEVADAAETCEETPAPRVDWLDVTTEWEGECPRIFHKNKNRDFCLGITAELATLRYGPAQRQTTQRQLRMWLSGSLHAILQQTNANEDVFTLGFGVIVELMLLGHSPKTLAKAINNLRAPRLTQMRKALTGDLEEIRRIWNDMTPEPDTLHGILFRRLERADLL
jgi:hypothetical protein